MRPDRVYLQYIKESIGLIRGYVTEGERSFREDMRTRDAALRCMETPADAAGHLSSAVKERKSQVDWRGITEFRNVLAHGYTDIRLERVWDVIVDDLPALESIVDQELKRASGDPGS